MTKASQRTLGNALLAIGIALLENESLNRGDIDGVFGPENLLDPTDPKQDSTAYALQRWLSTHARGYLPLRERQDIAWAYNRRRIAERV